MSTINIYEAKTQLSQLVERAARGEDVVIGKAGKPMVRMVPFVPETSPRVPGAWKGRVVIPDDFDDLPDEVQDAFDGKHP